MLPYQLSVSRIFAQSTGVSSDTVNDDQAEGLANHVYMMEGMITRNLRTVQGLANGTLGTVHALGLAEAEVAGDAPPGVISIVVPAYTTPQHGARTTGHRWSRSPRSSRPG